MAKHGKTRTAVEYYAVRLFFAFLGAFPLSVSMRVGELIAAVALRIFKRLRFVASRNLIIAFPDLSPDKRERILRDSFRFMGRQLGLIAHLPKFSARRMREMFAVEGLEHVEEVKKAGRGVILFTAHFGAWEASHQTLAVRDLPMNVLVRAIDNPRVEAFVRRLRERFGSRIIDKRTSAREMFRLLRRGETLGILADLNVQEHEGIFANFFGVKASTTTSVAKLALRTGAAVLPGFEIWRDDKSCVLRLGKPLSIPAGDTPENVLLVTQMMNDRIEEFVRRYPAQWMWVHKRWNTRPPGEPNLYAKEPEGVD